MESQGRSKNGELFARASDLHVFFYKKIFIRKWVSKTQKP